MEVEAEEGPRQSLDMAVGNMVLDHWNGGAVKDPVSYFQANFQPGGLGESASTLASPRGGCYYRAGPDECDPRKL